MSGNIIEEACFTVPLLTAKLSHETIIHNHGMSEVIHKAITTFLLTVTKDNVTCNEVS